MSRHACSRRRIRACHALLLLAGVIVLVVTVFVQAVLGLLIAVIAGWLLRLRAETDAASSRQPDGLETAR